MASPQGYPTGEEVPKAEENEEKDEDDEESEDDSDEEPPPDFFKERPVKERTSVSAEAYGAWNKKEAFVPPVIPKTDEQKVRLKECLSKSFLFSNLDDGDFNVVIGAMKEVKVEPAHRIINQGDDGEFLCVVESGKMDCLIKLPDGSEKHVKTCETGDVFGELALLYSCPRAASVQAAEESVLWELDRGTFNNIVKEAAQKKREKYEKFLSKVPLLQEMAMYKLSQLADALTAESAAEGSVIVRQGEEGKKFYIIESGEAIATKGDAEVMKYGSGDYFGELALLRNEPRAATVTCKTACNLLTLNSRNFRRLLDVDALVERSKMYE